MQKAWVHVVDDEADVRDSLEMLLSSAGFSVRTYPTALTFLTAAPGLETGCILMDIRMPDIDGLTLQKELSRLGCDLPIIVMTGYGDVKLAVEAMKSGAVDFLQKPFDNTQLIGVVRNAAVSHLQTRETIAGIAAIAARFAMLTPREREVMNRLVTGHPNKTIAIDLGASPRTVEVHRARVMENMGARNLADLVRMAIDLERSDKTQGIC